MMIHDAPSADLLIQELGSGGWVRLEHAAQ